MKGRSRHLATAALAFASLIGGVALAAHPIGGVAGYRFFAAGFVLFTLLAWGVPIPSGETKSTSGRRFITHMSVTQAANFVFAPLSILFWLVFAGYGLDAFIAIMSSIFGLGMSAIPIWALVERLFWSDRTAKTITVEKRTLTVQNERGHTVVPYEDIRSIERNKSRLVLTLKNDRIEIPILGTEAYAYEILTAIQAAKDGAGAVQTTTPASLLRPPGASTREWLTGVDALASLASTGGAYRVAGVEEGDLFATLDDPNADADARVAAARLLSRTTKEEARQRIALAVEKIEEPAVRTRVELGMKSDLEEAVAELEANELEENERAAGR